MRTTLLALVACLPLAAPAAKGQAVETEAPAARAELVLDPHGFSSAVNALDFSPDGRLLAAAGSKEVRVWDVASGELVATLRGQREKGLYGNCYSVAFSPDGQELVVGVDAYGSEGSLRVYRTVDLSRIDRLLAGHNAPVKRLAFTRDGRYLASAGEDGRILFWQWSDHRLVGSAGPADARQPVYQTFDFPTAAPILLVRQSSGVALLAVPGGQRLTTRDPLPDELRRWLGQMPQLRLPTDEAAIHCASLRLDRSTFLLGGNGKSQGRDAYWLGVWRGESVVPAQVYRGHRYVISAAALDPAANLAASADLFGEIHLWDTATGQVRQVLRGVGRPIYRVAFDPQGRSLGFGTTPLTTGLWDRNRFGTIEDAWQFDTRKVTSPSPQRYFTETPAIDGRGLTLATAGDRFELVYTPRNGAACLRKWRPGAGPMCFTLLRSPLAGSPEALAVGDDNGALLGYRYDPSRRELRVARDFVGHESFVTSLSESPDGRLLASSSTDGTIRLWSLKPGVPWGDVDFEYLSDTVVEVPPGSSAAAAGIRPGDRFLAFDGRNLSELERMAVRGEFPYRPGQPVGVTMQRQGRPYQAQVVLRQGNDAVQPLLSLFLSTNNEWIAWTPQGYYDASPGGDRLIGWHLNQGPDRSAKFYPVHQFRRELYRPDVIDLVWRLGDVDEAVRRANAARPRPPVAVDLRREETFRRLEPPRVRIVEPAEGARFFEEQITVRAEIQSQNELPIGEVTVLVNGRPQTAKAVRIEPAGDPRSRTLVERVTLVPGANQIGVMASNSASTSPPVTVDVTYEAGPKGIELPELHVLSIGISRYKQSRLNLEYAAKDAEDFAAAWAGQRGIVYRDIHVKTLVDEQATVQNILAGMEWVIRNSSARDVAVVFLSAHGVRDERNDYYLAAHEIDPDRLMSTAVHFSLVKKFLRDVPCKVLLFADTCHSGGITGAKGLSLEDPLVDLVSEECGAVVFSSSLPREVSFEDKDWGHGAFTKAILDTLHSPQADYNRDGYLSLTELEDQLDRRVKQLTRGHQHPVIERPPTVRNFSFYKFLGSVSLWRCSARARAILS